MLVKMEGYKKHTFAGYLVVYAGILLAAILVFLSFGFVISVHDTEKETQNHTSLLHSKSY